MGEKVNNTLVLIDNNRNGFFYNNYENIDIKEIYKSNVKSHRIIRKVFFKLRNSFVSHFLGEWYTSKIEYDLVIMFDTGNAKFLLPLIHDRYPKARIIVWFWNSVSKTISPSEVRTEYAELWSFDPNDCKKYKMNYNTQFFVEDNVQSINRNDEINGADVFFVGTEKGRLTDLAKLQSILNRSNISFLYHIVGKIGQTIPQLNIKYSRPLSYGEVLVLDSKAKAIVDIVSKGQNGLTLRPLEALFLRKKLITNMESITDYNLYNKNNIYIVGKDSVGELKEFIETPYDTSGYDYLVDYYSFPNWVSRFWDNKETSNA